MFQSLHISFCRTEYIIRYVYILACLWFLVSVVKFSCHAHAARQVFGADFGSGASAHAARLGRLGLLRLRLRELAHLLVVGPPLRRADGGDNGVRLVDLDGDQNVAGVVSNEQAGLAGRTS